jgi:AraC-like DNA-binding protein
METSILASAARPLWRYLEANKVDADSLFKRFGLDSALIHEPRSRFSYQLLCQAWVEAAAITQNENVGFESARHYTPLDLNALGVTFLSSSTLMEALQRLVRYESVLNSNLTFSITESGERLDLTSELAAIPADAVRIVEDSRTSVLINLCRLGLDMALDPVEVAFTYPEPTATGEHFSVFRCPVKFSQPASRISFKLADVRRPFTAANRELAISSDQILEEMINDQNQSDIVSQVKRAIIDDLPSGTPSEENIAKRVFVSSRTLQRRLSDENTNFRTLVLEVRRELAQKYLADKTMPLAEISYMLGFSDTSSFSRAFKKWTGDPPAVFRTNLLA